MATSSNGQELAADLELAMQDYVRREEERIARSLETVPLFIELLDDLIPGGEESGTGMRDVRVMESLPDAPGRSSFEDEESCQEAIESWRARVLPIIRMRPMAFATGSKTP